MSMNVEELREKALAKFDARSVRLIDELEEMLKLLVFQREALKNSAFEGLGYKQKTLDINQVRASKELSFAYTRMVEAQIKLDKHLKQVAEMMTPEEERDAVKKYVASLSTADSCALLSEMVSAHNRKLPKNVFNPLRIKEKAEMTFRQDDEDDLKYATEQENV
jgi:hypothetical protein